MHDAGWKNIFTSADVSMLGYGCGVSQYLQFYDQNLDEYQVLPCPHMESFESYPGKKSMKGRWVLDLSSKAETFVW